MNAKRSYTISGQIILYLIYKYFLALLKQKVLDRQAYRKVGELCFNIKNIALKLIYSKVNITLSSFEEEELPSDTIIISNMVKMKSLHKYTPKKTNILTFRAGLLRLCLLLHSVMWLPVCVNTLF